MLRLFAILSLLVAAPGARALEVLSAGAVERGLAPVIAAFPGTAATIRYATAPQLRARLAEGARPDLLVAPVDQIGALALAGQLRGDPVPIGRIGIGAAVRIGAKAPPIDDLPAFTAAVEAAERVVFNRASTGTFLERLFERLGLTATVAAKSVRYTTGAEVMHHIERGDGVELGLAPIPEILLVPTVHYLGPLPEAAQNRTAYAAAVPVGAPPEAAALLAWLARQESRAAFAAAGIEAP